MLLVTGRGLVGELTIPSSHLNPHLVLLPLHIYSRFTKAEKASVRASRRSLRAFSRVTRRARKFSTPSQVLVGLELENNTVHARMWSRINEALGTIYKPVRGRCRTEHMTRNEKMRATRGSEVEVVKFWPEDRIAEVLEGMGATFKDGPDYREMHQGRQHNWAARLPEWTYAHNSTRDYCTGMSPHEALFGSHPPPPPPASTAEGTMQSLAPAPAPPRLVPLPPTLPERWAKAKEAVQNAKRRRLVDIM